MFRERFCVFIELTSYHLAMLKTRMPSRPRQYEEEEKEDAAVVVADVAIRIVYIVYSFHIAGRTFNNYRSR